MIYDEIDMSIDISIDLICGISGLLGIDISTPILSLP